jgi:NAD(P)-dependent dehydrogenase (short-subunit alcohol dehydrogenase family)
MEMAPQLAGKVAIVTGGSRGIGLAIASALLSRGADVMISGRSQEHLEAARGRLVEGVAAAAGPAGRLETMRADVRYPARVAELVDGTVERFGGLDILVNNAGVGVFSPVADLAVDGWHDVLDTNLSGVFYCCRAAIPHLRSRGGGWILNISSLAGKNSFPGAAAYCASKAGLNAFSEALMQEVRYDGIRVAYVMPGSVRTEFAGHEAGSAEDWKLAPEDVAQVVVDLIAHPGRSLPSRVEIRPAAPRK